MRTENIREVPLEEIADLPVHPVADVFPILAKNSTDRDSGKLEKQTTTLAELADSILVNGLQEPIVIYDSPNGKMLLDGRNRRKACVLAAQTDKIPHEEFMVLIEDFIGTEEEADEFVFITNDRRDTTASQKAISAAKFEFEAPEAFARMKEKALGNKQAAALKATAARTGGNVVPNVGDNVELSPAIVNEMLAKKFHVSRGYVEDARRKLAEEARLREAAEKEAEEAEELRRKAAEDAAKMELAKLTGDEEAVHVIAVEINEAQNMASQLEESVAQKSQKASELATDIQSTHDGKKSVRGSKPDSKEESDDPVRQIRTRINTKFSGLTQDMLELAKITGQGEDEYNFIGRKVSDFIEEFEEAFGIVN